MDREQQTDLLPLLEGATSFDVVLRGYDRHQVHEHLERLEADLRIIPVILVSGEPGLESLTAHLRYLPSSKSRWQIWNGLLAHVLRAHQLAARAF